MKGLLLLLLCILVIIFVSQDKIFLIKTKAKTISNSSCWNATIEMKKYLDSIGIENEIITCSVNICQNEEPENIFYSPSHGEIGYYYNGEWFSEEECLRGHVFNKFIINNETYYIDITRSTEPFKEKNKYWKCFRY